MNNSILSDLVVTAELVTSVNKIWLEGPPGDMPWPPKAAPAPVRGPPEDVYP